MTASHWFTFAVDTEESSCRSELLRSRWRRTTQAETSIMLKAEILRFAQDDSHTLDLYTQFEVERSVVAAEGVAFGAVDGAPAVGHFAADFPEIGKEFVAHAFLQYFYGTTF